MERGDLLDKLKVHREILLMYKGQGIVDSKLAKILEEIEEKGSILSAAKSQGVSYSWVWNKISETEKLLGQKIVKVKRGGRGGGGAILTETGRTLLATYKEALSKDHCATSKDVILGGGYDPVVEEILDRYSNGVRFQWMGSLAALAALLSGTIDIAGVHLYDPETGTFNIPHIRKLWLSDSLIVMRGFEREMGLMFRPGIDISSPHEIIERKLRYVNLARGNGTRMLADCLLKISARMIGHSDPDLSRLVKGYDTEVKTSFGVAKKISKGKADVGFGIRKIAVEFGLEFKRILWENYDFAIRKESLSKPAVTKAIEALTSEGAKKVIRESDGYRIPPDFGAILLR